MKRAGLIGPGFAGIGLVFGDDSGVERYGGCVRVLECERKVDMPVRKSGRRPLSKSTMFGCGCLVLLPLWLQSLVVAI